MSAKEDKEDDVITLSSDSENECEIVNSVKGTGSIKSLDNNVLGNLKDQLSQIRGFTSQKNQSSVRTLAGGSSPVVNGRGRTNNPVGISKAGLPEEVFLIGDDDSSETDDENNCGGKTACNSNSAKVGGCSSESQIDDANDGVEVLEQQECLDDESEPIIAEYDQGVYIKVNKFSNDHEISPEESGNLDEISEPAEEPGEDEYFRQSEKLIEAVWVEFIRIKQGGVTKKKLKKAREKLDLAYDELRPLSKTVHLRLQEELKNTVNELRLSFALCQGNRWTCFKKLLDVMEPNNITKQLPETESEIQEAAEQKKQRLIREAERTMKKLQKKIKKFEVMEDEFDQSDFEENDHNSPYIRLEKYKKRLMDLYYGVCDLTKCGHVTGRPVQKCIRLKKHNADTSYVDIDRAVEGFVNRGGFLFIPDFVDILDVVGKANVENLLELSSETVMLIAQTVFPKIAKIIKKRREADLKQSLLCHMLIEPGEGEILPENENNCDSKEYDLMEDPADKDPQLKRKLEENARSARTENDVLKEFTEKYQAMRREGEAASEGVEDSEDEEEEEEDDDSGARDQQLEDAKRQQATLTEDEDEEPEIISLPKQEEDDEDVGGNTNDDDDDTSNDGKIAECESDTSTSTSNHVSQAVSSVQNNESEKRKIDDQESVEVASEDCPPNKKLRSDENSNESESHANSKA